jgi:hypothetical protein
VSRFSRTVESFAKELIPVNELTAHMADFRHYMRIYYTPDGWHRSDGTVS